MAGMCANPIVLRSTAKLQRAHSTVDGVILDAFYDLMVLRSCLGEELNRTLTLKSGFNGVLSL